MCRAAQALADQRGEAGTEVLAGDVDLGREDRMAQRRHAQRLGGGRRPVHVGHDHERAFARQPFGDRKPDAAGGPVTMALRPGKPFGRCHGQLSRRSGTGPPARTGGRALRA